MPKQAMQDWIQEVDMNGAFGELSGIETLLMECPDKDDSLFRELL